MHKKGQIKQRTHLIFFLMGLPEQTHITNTRESAVVVLFLFFVLFIYLFLLFCFV